MRTHDAQQKRLPMSHTKKDTSKAVLDTDMYIYVDDSQTKGSRGGSWSWSCGAHWPFPAHVGSQPK